MSSLVSFRRFNSLNIQRKPKYSILIISLCIIIILILISSFSLMNINSPQNLTKSNINHHQRNETNIGLRNEDLQKAISLSMYYLTRNGHKDRVEYLIGFQSNQTRTKYINLQIRNTQKYERNYDSNPIKMGKKWKIPSINIKCDLKCIPCSNSCDIKRVHWNMENIAIRTRKHYIPQSGDISGNCYLSSQIPVPYFSWFNFGFMSNVRNKSEISLAAAFISNCKFKKRLKIMEKLQINGITIDSYGKCLNNRKEKRNENGREFTKIDIWSRYKFALAFENSETDDYVSEKFFGALVSGSVPVYMGAPNIAFFAPDAGGGKPWKSHSVINVNDFKNVERLAEYLLYLSKNESAYDEYLQWKIDGYSADFKAMVDLTSTHTSCRQCILAGDRIRYLYGITNEGIYDQFRHIFQYQIGVNDERNDKIFYVRERGNYRFTKIIIGYSNIEEISLKTFVGILLQSMNKKYVELYNNQHPNYQSIGPAVYAIYHIPSKYLIHSSIALQLLPNHSELEIILL